MMVESLEKDNENLKVEAQNIFEPLEEKVQEVTDLNIKLEKKVKTLKQEKQALIDKLEKIEADMEQITLRGFGSIAHVASNAMADRKEQKLVENYERQLKIQTDEIKRLQRQKRELQNQVPTTSNLRFKHRSEDSPVDISSPGNAESPNKSSINDEPVLGSLLTHKNGVTNDQIRTRVGRYDTRNNSKENRHPQTRHQFADDTEKAKQNRSMRESSEIDISRCATVVQSDSIENKQIRE